jgi:hypothetical protein
MNVNAEIMALIKSLRKDATTQGISEATGLTFYYLEQQAKNIYPVFYPLLASTARVNPMFNGMKVGGNAVNWKAITAIDTGGYPALSEGNRNEAMNITTRQFSAPFKFLGKDIQTSFQAQAAGLGFDDMVALSQLSLLNALLNDEERMLLFGNSGTSGVGGANGYVLGTTPTPTVTLNTDSTSSHLPAGSVTVYCVALTPWGAWMATSTGVALPRLRTNQDGSTDIINGGTAIVSAASNTVTTDSSHTSVTAAVTPVQGAVAYAWFISTNGSPTTANAFFSAVTSTATAKLTSYVNTNQAANAQSSTVAGSAGNLTADHSYNNLDFDGLMTTGFTNASASQPSYWKDLNGAGFTANGDGTIAEIEAVADFMWKTYKISIDKIYLGGSLMDAFSKAVLTASGGANASQRLMFTMDETGRIVGGTKVVQYRWKYSTTAAAKTIDVMTHPWLPDGCVYFDLINNPYPAAGNAIPAVRRIVSLEDHFSLKFPYRRLQHELGVYCFETLEHYIQFGVAQLTGVANKVN